MEDFVTQIVAPRNEQLAEKFFLALRGKGAFRRFKDVLSSVSENGHKHGTAGEAIISMKQCRNGSRTLALDMPEE